MSSILRSDDMNALVDSVQHLKISALVNAAKISPLVQERTLGPKKLIGLHQQDTIESKPNQNNGHANKTNLTNGTHDGVKFRKDVWREVNISSEENGSSRNAFQLNDCKAVSFRLAANNAEKQRRAKISTDLQEKQSQWDMELEERMQRIRIDSAEKQKEVHAKRLERERLALQAIEKIEAQAKQDELKSNLRKTEMIEHSRKLIEHANQLKRQDEIRLLVEAINANKQLFINLFEMFAKTIVNNTALLKQTEQFSEYLNKRDTLLQRYEAIMKSVNAKTITTADTDLLDSLCADIKQEQINLNAHIQASQKALSEAAAKPVTVAVAPVRSETAAKAPLDPLKAANANEVSVTDAPNVTTEAIRPIGSDERISHYNELINFYQTYTVEIKPLVDDPNLKKFRFNCQKGVNLPVNSIPIGNSQQLQDKFEKIASLLSGNQVSVDNIAFTANEHPLGVKYCSFLLAKKFINQGVTVTSSHYEAAFPLAAVVVSVWQLYPDIRKLFLAMLYMESPFFVPSGVPYSVLQTGDENIYCRYLGYKIKDDKLETETQYLKRISGLQRLYSAVLITKVKRSQQHLPHPYGLENGWVWLTNLIMLDPHAGVCSTLLLEFLQICGFDMWQAYKTQFLKVMVAVLNQYISKLGKVDTGGPYSRLVDLVTAIAKENKISPPKGTLQANFW